jgi:hypothetical protein
MVGVLVSALVPFLQQPATPGELTARVNPSVELLSIVFRLAGNPEYNMPNSKSPYAEEVEKQFGRFRDHPVVQLARKLRRDHGVSYDAVMSVAVHLDTRLSGEGPGAQADVEFKPGLGAKPARLDPRWEQEDAREFLKQLREFAREADFAGFATAHELFYKQAAGRLSSALAQRAPVAWFDRFFGARPRAKFDLYVGLLNGGGCYGVSVAFEDGREEVSPVIGAAEFDRDGLPVFGDWLEETVVHEFAHTYTNAFVDQFADQLQSAGERLYAGCAATMQDQAYGNWKTLMYESLARATTLRYVRTTHDAAAADKAAQREAQRGFAWAGELADLLGDYEANRTRYATFADFMPRVVEFFDRYAGEYEAHVAKAPKVVQLIPTNGAEDVDPDLSQLKITFDRPMQDGNWSIVGGGPHLPELIGKPSYDASHRVLTVRMRLKPDWTYEFWLNRGQFDSFRSAEGVRLESVHVQFKTRSK